MGEPTSLYRFFDAAGLLLYVGITKHGRYRWEGHRHDKAWWGEVATVTVEHYPDRPSALGAEESAIKAEHPRYNIVHNRSALRDGPTEARRKPRSGAQMWVYESLRSGYQFTEELWLSPEPNLSSCVDDVYPADGREQLAYWIDYVRRSDAGLTDHHHIFWVVQGEHHAFEVAPLQPNPYLNDDFLSHFTWPYNAETGEDLDWFKLPVRWTRFPELRDALGYQFAPLQPTMPLRTIVHQHQAWLEARRGALAS